MSNSVKIFVFLFILASTIMFGHIAIAERKLIFVIHSYDESMTWTQQCNQGIREALTDDFVIESWYMDTKRIPSNEFQKAAKAAIKEFKRLQPDVVMVSDDNALRLVGPEIAATGVPLVYLGVNGNPRQYFDVLPENVVGVIERIPLFHWVRFVFDIVPNCNSLLVLTDSSPTAEAIISASFRNREVVVLDKKKIYWKSAQNWSSWQQLVLNTKSDSIIMPVYHALRDDEGTHVPYHEVISWTSAHSRVPVFASQDYAVGDKGVVGSYAVVGEEHGRLAGRIVRSILEGESMHDLSVADDQQGALYFNRTQLKRFGLVLPPRLREKAIFK